MPPARADDGTANPEADSGIFVSGHVEAGLTGNPAARGNRINFGQPSTDHADQIQLNQLVIAIERKLDPAAQGWDFGFRLVPMIGSDARLTHFLGELDTASHGRMQLDIIDAKFLVHSPLLTAAGCDFTVGQYVTPMGYEVIDATGNPFYSHSYNYQFGNPAKHTGGYAVLHVDPTLDFYLGGDTGVNTSLGQGDNNSSPAFLGGFGLNSLIDGKLTMLVLSHIGPENPDLPGRPKLDKYLRYINDAVATYRADDAITLAGEIQYVHDEFLPADAYGVSLYVSDILTPQLTLNGRAELFQDHKGFYVAEYPGNFDALDSQKGLPNTAISSSGTFGELTLGVTYTPPVDASRESPKITLRPEMRFDRHFDGLAPFNRSEAGAGHNDQITFAVDLTLSF